MTQTRSQQENSKGSEMTMEEALRLNPMAPAPTRGTLIEGTISMVTQRGAFVDYGSKFDGFVPTEQLGNLTTGDHTILLVTDKADENGMVELSVTQAVPVQELEQHRRAGSTVTVRVVEVVRKGRILSGAFCSYGSVKGFVPFPSMGCSPTKLNALLGKEIGVKVLECLPRITFDRKTAEQERLAVAKQALLTTLKPGDIVDGKVDSIGRKDTNEYGVFVDLGDGVTGLLHRNEIPGANRMPLSLQFKPGDAIKVKFLNAAEVNGKTVIALSVKDLRRQQFIAALNVGDEVEGRIARQTVYGFFLCLSAEAGVDGLLHNSRIPAGSTLAIGDVIKVKIHHLDRQSLNIGVNVA